MINFESQLTEAKLLAEFTPDQQAFVDKLIAEYFKFFRGVKDADLKASFEKGDREALKTYREMIDKRQEILDFINKKDEREKMMSPEEKQKRFEGFEVGDKVLVVIRSFGSGGLSGKVEEATITAIDKTPGHEFAEVETITDEEVYTITDPDLLLRFDETERDFPGRIAGTFDKYKQIIEETVLGIEKSKIYNNTFIKKECKVLGFGSFNNIINVIYADTDLKNDRLFRRSIAGFLIDFEKVEDDKN